MRRNTALLPNSSGHGPKETIGLYLYFSMKDWAASVSGATSLKKYVRERAARRWFMTAGVMAALIL